MWVLRVLCVALTVSAAAAQDADGLRPLIEVPRASGSARMGDESTPQSTRQRALDAAFKDAIEQALGARVGGMNYLATDASSSTVKERFSSVIRAIVSGGVVTKHEVLEEGWVGKTPGASSAEYRVIVRAWVRQDEARARPSFDIQLALNARRFVARGSPESSDELVLKVKSAVESYLTVFLVVDDSIEVLFPNQYVPQVKALANRETEIPSLADREQLGLRLRTTLPRGTTRRAELLTVVGTLSPVPFPGVVRRTRGDAARVPTVQETYMALAKWLLSIPANQIGIADATYEIVRDTIRAR